MKTSDILRKAKAHISSPDMWLRGTYATYFLPNGLIPDDAPCCALGAISWAIGFEVETDETFEVDRLLYEATPGQIKSVPYFNDDPSTTHADIMALFDRAIAAAEATE